MITSIRTETNTTNEITIQLLELLDPSEVEFKIINNGNEIPYNLDIDINTLKFRFEADEGDEIESMSENVNSFKDLKILSVEMIGFLEALARSCPKGKALFVDMVKNAKRNKA